jgi:putative spermidine/putrescine transport system permease protein
VSALRGWRFGVILALTWALLFYLVAPMFIVVPVSLTDQRYLSLPQHAVSFQHYRNIVGDNFWLPSIAQSCLVAGVSTTIAVTLGTLCAIGCWRLSSRLSAFVRLLMLLPLIVPSIVHALGFFRMWIDLDLLDSFAGVILAHVITSLPYVVITVSTALANFDVRLEQAARNLGASLGQTIRLVIVPGILPGVLSGAIFAFVHAWDEIVVLLFITSRHVYLLPRAIWDGINDNVDPTIAAIATLMILLTLLGLLIQGGLRRGADKRAAEGMREPIPPAAAEPALAAGE